MKENKGIKRPRITKNSFKNIKLKYLLPTEIEQQLWDHGWLNNTLSPISTTHFWAITTGIIPKDAECISGFFAQSYAGSLVHRTYTFICTTKYVYAIMEVSGVVTYKILKYEDFAEINLYQDEFLTSQIYIDIYLTKFRFYRLETNDPTSVLHFKKTIIQQQIKLGTHKTLANVASRSFAERAGMGIFRFFWTKFRYLLNIRTDAKVKHQIKKQRKLAQKQAEENKKTTNNNDELSAPTQVA